MLGETETGKDTYDETHWGYERTHWGETYDSTSGAAGAGGVAGGVAEGAKGGVAEGMSDAFSRTFPVLPIVGSSEDPAFTPGANLTEEHFIPGGTGTEIYTHTTRGTRHHDHRYA